MDIITINFRSFESNSGVINISNFPSQKSEFPEITTGYIDGGLLFQGCKNEDFMGISLIYFARVSDKCKINLIKDIEYMNIENPFIDYCNNCNVSYVTIQNKGKNTYPLEVCGDNAPSDYRTGEGIEIFPNELSSLKNNFCTNRFELESKETKQIFRTFPEESSLTRLSCNNNRCKKCHIDLIPFLMGINLPSGKIINQTNIYFGDDKITLPEMSQDMRMYSIDSDYKVIPIDYDFKGVPFCEWVQKKLKIE